MSPHGPTRILALASPGARTPVLAALVAAVLVACGGGETPTPRAGDGADTTATGTSVVPRRDMPPEVAAQIDSGNAAYRAREFEEARRHFLRATELDPDLATAWFGVHMAEKALGNAAAADSALRRAGEAGEAARSHHMPPGHPPLPDTGSVKEKGTD